MTHTANRHFTAAADLAPLLLRLVLGLLVLLHGVAKVMAGPGYMVALVSKAGLPSFVAYGVYLGEVVAPLLLMAGLCTRAAAIVVAVNMLFAFALVHTGDLFHLSKTGGWALELQGLYLVTALALALLGAGRYSLDAAIGHRLPRPLALAAA